MTSPRIVVILAAGQGSRMKSALPKVLHPIAGKPLLQHVIDTASTLNPEKLYVVYGHGGEKVREAITKRSQTVAIDWVHQAEQLGTGHAVKQVFDQHTLPKDAEVLVLYGDVPLTKSATLEALLEKPAPFKLLTMQADDPTGYGRIVRDAKNAPSAIVEEKDADERVKQIKEVNTGILATDAAWFNDNLGNLSADNAQGEFYLTDLVAMSYAANRAIDTVIVTDPNEVAGVNNRAQLSDLEREYQITQARNLQAGGVTIADPKRLDCRGNIQVAQDVTIDINVILEGEVTIGTGAYIGANVVIKNATIGENVRIEANSIVEGSVVSNECVIGPYARIRPDSILEKGAKVGNFVELKKTTLGKGSKANHLAYVGDATVGESVNIGAGTITCNYDGANKHQTILEDGVFVGSDTQLVAPVRVGKNATIGAGTTVTKDVSQDALCISRSPQKEVMGWERPQKSGSKEKVV